MDFGTLLHVAKRNNEQGSKNAEGKYYSTKFSAPKKESKEKKLSDNIKKFLAKRELEEQQKTRLEKQKCDQLLALRDEKAKNKIKKMLKVIKSANKSVLDDAVDTQNTAVTLQGPEQPDEDDYGYVSQEASAFYQKYMDKVKTMPEENKFAPSRPNSRTDLSGTKDRVRAAILKEQEELSTGSRSKSSKPSEPSTSSSSSSAISAPTHRRKDLYDPQVEKEAEEKKKRAEEQKKSKSRKPAPPPINFQQLLKLAEKKQFEPVEIVVETKKEPERLLTKKEKRDLEERRQYLQEREQRKKEREQGGGAGAASTSGGAGAASTSGGAGPASTSGGNKMQPNGRIPKLNGTTSSSSASNDKSSKPKSNPSVAASSTPLSVRDNFKKPISSNSLSSSKNEPPKSNSSPTLKSKNPASSSIAKSSTPNQSKAATFAKPQSKPISKQSSALPSSSSSSQKPQAKQPYNGQPREFPPRDVHARKQAQPQNGRGSDIKSSGNPRDVERTRQFPPSDVRGGPKPMKKQQLPIKRRIYDDEDDSEYDSELDDFIDDGPEDGDNYSSYIKEIFGYDKSRYRDIDDDDRGMESNFAQQMKEEFVSKKIGLMEDLEDMRLEAQEKKKKAIKKKKLK